MKTIILAGGFGTRLSEYTGTIPKPMVPIGGKPILWHIMNNYAHFNHKDFYLALGYKSEIIKDYFLKYSQLNSDFTINLSSGTIKSHQIDKIDWKVTLVNTGETTMTGGRVKKLQSYIGNETFMLTYGDGLSNVNISKLIDFHKSHGKMVTVTAVRPNARFGELEIENSKVINFQEKPQMHQGWINGGFFVIEPSFFNYIDNDDIMLEREPLEKITKLGELMAYYHDDFWQCMDTKRDHDLFENLWASKKAPWLL
jgi:glucose-1-phosphate cytidylyltransferase